MGAFLRSSWMKLPATSAPSFALSSQLSLGSFEVSNGGPSSADDPLHDAEDGAALKEPCSGLASVIPSALRLESLGIKGLLEVSTIDWAWLAMGSGVGSLRFGLAGCDPIAWGVEGREGVVADDAGRRRRLSTGCFNNFFASFPISLSRSRKP
ncbi:hypothetical protein BKA70DRAFT_1315807 [Coprinopsis sp. MPI-PUGE-AT-0042]|nr:hypothetical protein BKA70DRAFT_1315807 [Coprinopsis sp. MPI-PUGE-AT-0042]